MLDHIDITVKDLNQSKKFYKSLLSVLGINEFSENVYGVKFYDKKDYIWICQGIPKRFHFAFSAQDKKQVDDFYQLAQKSVVKVLENLIVRMITIIHVTS